MKRPILLTSTVLIAAIMLALSISAVFADKPITMTLTGTFRITGYGDNYEIVAGKSDNYLIKIRNAPQVWTGDISGSGTSDGNWLVKGGPLMEGGELAVAVGTVYLDDVTIAGVGTGDLTLGYSGLEYWIKCGSDDLRSIRGKGAAAAVNPIKYNYELVVQINP